MYYIPPETTCWVLPKGGKKWQPYVTRKPVGFNDYEATFANWYIFCCAGHRIEVEVKDVEFKVKRKPLETAA